jgi:hypothetical protein
VEIYFYDVNKRYIGHRTLREGEAVPTNATTISVSLDDGQEAYFENGEWTMSDIESMPVQPCDPTIECRVEATEAALIDLMNFIMLM